MCSATSGALTVYSVTATSLKDPGVLHLQGTSEDPCIGLRVHRILVALGAMQGAAEEESVGFPVCSRVFVGTTVWAS